MPEHTASRRYFLAASLTGTMASIAGCNAITGGGAENQVDASDPSPTTETPNSAEITAANELDSPLRAQFEDGTIAPFENVSGAEWAASSELAYQGEYSIGIRQNSPPESDPDLRWELSEAIRPNQLTFYWYEYEAQQNGALALLDADDRIVTGGGTNNPNWTVWRTDDASGENWYQGEGYQRWVRMTFDFDWDNEEILVTGEDIVSGTVRQTIAHPVHSNPVSSIVIASNNYNAETGEYNVASGTNHGNPKSMYFDQIELR